MADQPTVHSSGVALGRVCAQPAEQACLVIVLFLMMSASQIKVRTPDSIFASAQFMSACSVQAVKYEGVHCEV